MFGVNDIVQAKLEHYRRTIYLFLSNFWMLLVQRFFFKRKLALDCGMIYFWNCLNIYLFLKFKIIWQLQRQHVCNIYYTKYQVPFNLRWFYFVAKRGKAPIYYGLAFLLWLFTSLIVNKPENSPILASKVNFMKRMKKGSSF